MTFNRTSAALARWKELQKLVNASGPTFHSLHLDRRPGSAPELAALQRMWLRAFSQA